MKSMAWKALVSLIVAGVILIVPSPEGLKVTAWYYFALFAAVIVGLILEPIPIASLGLIGIALAATLGLVEPKPGDSIRWALGGFSNNTVWLIFGAFMFAMGYEKTGLGRRIALTLVKVLGGKTLGLGYAVALADLVLAPVTPSNTARTGGTIFPIVPARRDGSKDWFLPYVDCFRRQLHYQFDVYHLAGAERLGHRFGEANGKFRYLVGSMVHRVLTRRDYHVDCNSFSGL